MAYTPIINISIDREQIDQRKLKEIINLQPKITTPNSNIITRSKKLLTEPRQNTVRKRVSSCR